MILPAGPATANRTCILEKKRQQGFSVVKPLLAVASAAEVASSKVASPSPFLFSPRKLCRGKLSLSRVREQTGTGRRKDEEKKRRRERCGDRAR